MKEAAFIIFVALGLIVGAVCMLMAVKSLGAKRMMPFHENASGESWESLGAPMQTVLLALLKQSGFGFLAISLLLFLVSAGNLIDPNVLYSIICMAAALVFSLGLFAVNYSLFKKSGQATPWKGALIAAVLLAAGIVLRTFS